MSSFSLEILTPDRQFFAGQVDSLVIPIIDGEYGVQQGHDPVVTIVTPGTLRYRIDGQWKMAAVTSGIAEIMPEHTILLLSAAEYPEEIDLVRAQAAKKRAEDRLREQSGKQEHASARAALSRAMARLKTRQS